jgi:hypothetical protein
MLASSKQQSRSPFAFISAWWRNWTRFDPVTNPTCCLDGEVERLANDIGMPVTEVRRLAKEGPEAADLLLQRMAALKLDRKKIGQLEPQTFRDLQRVCTLCESRRQCSLDLTLELANSHWESYCPNVATLRTLKTQSAPVEH